MALQIGKLFTFFIRHQYARKASAELLVNILQTRTNIITPIGRPSVIIEHL